MKRFKIYLQIIISLLLLVVTALPAIANDKYTVVIDAGHGGKDHGAIDNNVREKDINLKVALEVGKLIKKQNKNINVVYTRDNDTFLTLQQRADKANKAKGDLFISIHTNSVDKKNPNRTTVEGASTYTLGLHKENDNMEVAKRENNVMALEENYAEKYNGFNPNSDESYIIFEMAQKANMTQSTKFAKEVQRQLTHVARRKDRGVHQAGFWVLWATSMPSVLIELDFICNPTSAEYLSSSTGQKNLATGIANAVTNYFKALSQHKKNRLKAKNNSDENDNTFSDGSDGVVLSAASQKSERKSKTAPSANTPGVRTRGVGVRRRRSDASREKSERQQYAIAVIQEEEAYIDNNANVQAEEDYGEPVVVYGTPSTTDKKKTRVSRPAKRPSSTQTKSQPSKNKTVAAATSTKKTVEKTQTKPTKISANDNKRKGETASTAKKQQKTDTGKQQKKASSASPVRMQKTNIVYKILVYTSTEKLKMNSAVFCGLNPITCIQDGKEYKYVYGESKNRNEIYQLLADVQKDIPDASVITVRKASSAQ